VEFEKLHPLEIWTDERIDRQEQRYTPVAISWCSHENVFHQDDNKAVAPTNADTFQTDPESPFQ